MRTPDIRPCALNGRTELQNADISALGYRLQKQLDTFVRDFPRHHTQNATVQLG